jgi:hypothetical protein
MKIQLVINAHKFLNHALAGTLVIAKSVNRMTMQEILTVDVSFQLLVLYTKHTDTRYSP